LKISTPTALPLSRTRHIHQFIFVGVALFVALIAILVVKVGSDQSSSGTGFIVSRQGHVITSFKTISDAQNVIVYYDGEGIRGEVVARDKANDLIILKFNRVTMPIKFSKYSAKKGEELLVVGYTGENDILIESKATFGHISKVTGNEGDIRFYSIDADLENADYGSPIYNMSGNLIGMTTENPNSGMKIAHIKAMLDTYSVGYQESVHPKPMEGSEIVRRSKTNVVRLIAHQ